MKVKLKVISQKLMEMLNGTTTMVELEVPEKATVEDALRKCAEVYPNFQKKLPEINKSVLVVKDNKLIKDLSTPLKEGDIIKLVPLGAGG